MADKRMHAQLTMFTRQNAIKEVKSMENRRNKITVLRSLLGKNKGSCEPAFIIESRINIST